MGEYEFDLHTSQYPGSTLRLSVMLEMHLIEYAPLLE